MLIDWTPLPRYVVIEYAFKSSLRDYICTFIGPDHALQKKFPLRKSGQLRALWIQCAADATTAIPPFLPSLPAWLAQVAQPAGQKCTKLPSAILPA